MMNEKETKFHSWDVFPVALALFAVVFVGLTASMGLFVVDWTSSLAIVFFVGFELIFIGVAYDFVEALLSLVLPSQDLPKLSLLTSFPPVAILVTVCDDVVPEILSRLKHQTYPNHHVFILDDSESESQHALADRSGFTVLRRGTRHGYKAGNLNNWLRQYGRHYKYFVVLDSDSIVPDDFVTRMVKYAEHPGNKKVAVFQGKIYPWNTTSLFTYAAGVLAPMRMDILARVANPSGTMLSWGHNNLMRTKDVVEVGGFIELISAEDTTLSLMLSARKREIKLVNVRSFDAEPEDVFRCARRTIRWARQTVEIFRLPWQEAQLRLKLLLCYHLYSYLSCHIYLGLILLTAWAFEAQGFAPAEFLTLVSDHIVWFIALLLLTGIWVTQVMLRLLLAKRAGIPLWCFALNCLLSTIIVYFLAFRMIIAMLHTALGGKVVFDPTNVGESHETSIKAIAEYMFPTLCYGILVLFGIVLRNHYLAFSVNSLWLILLLGTPIFLWALQRLPLKKDAHRYEV